MIITALLFSITASYDKILAVEFGIVQYLFLNSVVSSIFLYLHIKVFQKDVKISGIFQKHALKKISVISVIG